MIIEEIEKKISRIVHYRSSSLVDISNTENILSESFFKYPIIEYLERNLCSRIDLEKKHPNFKYRRIDIFWEKDSIKNYMELKCVKTRTPDELQRYFNDLLRLYYIFKSSKGEKINCYFLASGKSDDWNFCFKNYRIDISESYKQKEYSSDNKEETKESENAIYSNWFSFDIEEPEKIITKNNTESFYKEFKDEYKFSQENISFENDFKFKTRLLWINENSFRDPCSTAMWKIEIL